MNDEDSIQDLKQFISATVHQEVSDVRSDVHALDVKISRKIDNLAQSVAESLDTSNESSDTQLQDHEARIKKLEQKVA